LGIVKESLQTINNPKFEDIHPQIKYLLENVEEEHLQLTLANGGVYISESIILQYVQGYGFKSFNTDEPIIGKNPLCNLIERRMNQKLYSLVNS
jgi:hypothetical protein